MLVGEQGRAQAQAEARRRPGLNPLQHVLAATAGGVLTALFVTPFDVVKTRMQAQVQLDGARFASPLDACAQIARNEGPLALWRGLTPALLLTVPATAFYFTAYERIKSHLSGFVQPVLAPALAGLTARTITVCVTSPLELMRTYTQAQGSASGGAKPGLFSLLREEVRIRGFVSLWAGLGPTLLRDVPFSAIYWSCFEQARTQIHKRYTKGFVADFSAGVCAGLIAASATHPIDVVKTRRQMQLDPTSRHGYPVGTIAIFKEILAVEGIGGFWLGMLPRLAKVAPACAIMISSYELFKRIITVFGT